MKILIATTNQNKVIRIKRLFKNIAFISLSDLDYKIEEPDENGKDGVENAIIKAKYYYDHLKEKLPVLAQDDTLFLDEVSEEDNPKKDIKLPIIKKFGKFSDDNAYQYYSNLVKKYEKEYLELEFRYGHAICSENFLEGSASKIPNGRLYAQVSSNKAPGYFFNAMTKMNINGEWKYYSDLSEEDLINLDSDFKRSISSLFEKLNS